MRLGRFFNRVFLAVMLISILLLSGCSFADVFPTSGAQKENEEVASSEEVTPDQGDGTEDQTSDQAADAGDQGQEESSEEENDESEQKFRSLFTGEEITYNWLDHRPLAVMLNNIKAGCPQSGIENASIVYECPVEGRITRLMAIFEKYEEIPKIGSIRSSRDYFVYYALEFDAIYAHFGQATTYVGELLNSDAVDNISGAISGIDNPSTNAFYRSSDRKAPHNVYISNEGLIEDRDKFGYRTT